MAVAVDSGAEVMEEEEAEEEEGLVAEEVPWKCVAEDVVAEVLVEEAEVVVEEVEVVERKVVIEPHRHEGVFFSKSKDDFVLTKNLVPGDSVYNEKRISVQVNFLPLIFVFIIWSSWFKKLCVDFYLLNYGSIS